MDENRDRVADGNNVRWVIYATVSKLRNVYESVDFPEIDEGAKVRNRLDRARHNLAYSQRLQCIPPSLSSGWP